MPQRILGIDLGSWSVKGVLLEDSFRGYKVEGVFEERIETGPTNLGEQPTREERVQEALKAMLLQSELKIDGFAAAMPGEKTTCRFVNLPFDDAKKVAQIGRASC